MEEKKLGIVLLVIAIFLLGIAFYTNISNIFAPLSNPLTGEGLGKLCLNKDKCINFCQSNRGQCNLYCQENPSNKLCGELIPNN